MRHQRGLAVLRGTCALLLIVALLAGAPVALLVLGANPIPTSVPGLDEITDTLTRPDLDGSVFLSGLTYIAWVGWAAFALSVLLEIPAAIRGVPAVRIPGLRAPQRAAAGLVGMVIMAMGVGPLAAQGLPAPATMAAAPAPAVATMTVDTASDTPARDWHRQKPRTKQRQDRQPASYTVRPGDSLWKIADQTLGDGARWPEIADLNYGKPQPGWKGGLDHTHWIDPGWTLTLPIDVPTAAKPPQADRSDKHVVQPGDTLWDIAADDLGPNADAADIAREWPRWFKKNRATIGNDPDLIQPGMVLQDPDSDIDKPRRTEDAPERDTRGEQQPRPDERGDGSAHREQSTDNDDTIRNDKSRADPGQQDGDNRVLGSVPDHTDDGDDQTTIGLPVRTVGGVGALLAAGVLSLLLARRRRQRSKRRVGQITPTPSDETVATEQAMRDVADPIAVDIVDRALRTLNTTDGRPPVVKAARLTAQQFELYLAEPDQLPAPWQETSDAAMWVLPADVDTGALIDTTEVENTPAPYPSLVTLGHDAEGGHVLLNLEHVGALNIHGSAHQTRAVVVALAVELTTSAWADDLTATVVGACAELEQALGGGRLRYATDPDVLLETLEAHAKEDRTQLGGSAADTAAAARASGAGEWAPEIALIAVPLNSEQQQRLDDLLQQLPRTAAAVVTTGDTALTEWAIRIDPVDLAESILDPLGLPIQPQQINPDDYHALLDALATADKAPAEEEAAVPSDTSRAAESVEPGWTFLTDAVAEDDPVDWADLSTPAVEEALVGDPPTSRRPAASPPTAGGRVIDLIEHTSLGDDGTLQADLQLADGPIIRVLGPVRIEGARGSAGSSHIGQLTEIAAYIALHPGCTGEDLDQAIWPGEPMKGKTRAQACSRLRNWLGDKPGGGRYFPQALDGHYRFDEEVRLDWGMFNELAAGDAAQLPVERLEAAVALVTGQPFIGATGRRPKFRWADRLKADMITAIADVACVLADRALQQNQARRARAAATAGLQAEPGMEQLWRYLLEAEHQAGNHAAVEHAAERLHLILDELGTDPEPETAELVELLIPTNSAGRVAAP